MRYSIGSSLVKMNVDDEISRQQRNPDPTQYYHRHLYVTWGSWQAIMVSCSKTSLSIWFQNEKKKNSYFKAVVKTSEHIVKHLLLGLNPHPSHAMPPEIPCDHEGHHRHELLSLNTTHGKDLVGGIFFYFAYSAFTNATWYTIKSLHRYRWEHNCISAPKTEDVSK